LQLAAAILVAAGASIMFFVTVRPFYGAAFSSEESARHDAAVRKQRLGELGIVSLKFS